MELKKACSEEIKQEIFRSYCHSFPEEEKRDENDFWALFGNPKTHIISVSTENQTVGYIIFWELSDFIFVEHFEVFERCRNKNFGSKILKILQENFNKIILETEPEHLNDLAKRRVNFYQRNGFEILNKTYIQPSYGEGKQDLNLWLMGTFQPKNLSQNIAEIHKLVYQK